MERESFYDWLVNEKNYSHYSAKDVLSRCNRVRRLIGHQELSCQSLEALKENEVFCASSKYVKSQLRRAVSLFSEYQEAT